ncbi:transporter substrate-binding domain-containing protein [bacterium]|nr:transporter substrate-binding domain-containing protein [bacterium]
MMQRLLLHLLLWMFVLIVPITEALAASQTKQADTLEIEPNVVYEKWTGDLDGMVKRRVIRVLTAYSKTLYFLDKGTQRGIVFDAMKAFEDELNKKYKTGNLRVDVVFIPVSRDHLISRLAEGEGDVACANLTIDEERKKVVDFTYPTLKGVSEIVVTGPASPAISALQDLSGQEVFVRKSSSYYDSLVKLNQQFKLEGKKEIRLKLAPEELEDEDLLEMLNAGLVKILVVDDHVAVFWKQIFPKITLHPDLKVRSGGEIAWAIRKNSPLLMAELNQFVQSHGKGTAFGNMTLQKYLKATKFVKNAASDAERKKFFDLVKLFKKYSGQYNVDTLLMVAQGYQESQLNQNAKSSVGAIGIMQIMPATGKELKVGDITQVEPNIHGGVKYMRFMIDQYYKDEPVTDLNKALFTFASYNAGPNRIQNLRKETKKRGLDPNVWFNNVERVVSEKVGRETVTYVSNIYKYYIAYKLITEEQAEREKIKKELKH